MFTKKHIILTSFITCFVTAVIFIGGTCVYFKFGKDGVLTRAKDIICENYVDQLTDEQIDKMNDYALTAMVASLEDPYSYYFDAETYDSFEESTKEKYIGIGVTVSFDAETNQMVIISPVDNSPAQKAGILPGDVITRVDNIVVNKENYNDVVDTIKGKNAKEGTTVTLYVLRNGEEKVFELTRSEVLINTVSHKMIDDNIGYIRISEFKLSSVNEFSEAISEIKKDNAKGLIIDLRSNPGGYADSVLKMTDMLLPEGTIAYLEDNKGQREYFYSDKNYLDLPMVILVNEGTASAAELMAGSMQAYGKAKIVGMKTYGKAVGQKPYMLTESTAIYLTDARYYTPKGECIDKKGIIPDVEVDLPDELKAELTILDPSHDDQMRTATEILYDEIKK